MNVIASFNIKGGVGKTAAVVNLSYYCAADGKRTLIWDVDPQGAASFYYRIKPKIKGGGEKLLNKKYLFESSIKGTDYESLDLIPADFSLRNIDLILKESKRPRHRLRKLLATIEDQYDYVFIDCPPGLSLAAESVLFAADLVLVPTVPTVLSLRTLEQLFDFCRNNGLADARICPFYSMVDLRKEQHKSKLQQPSQLPESMLNSWIPYNSQVEKMGELRMPLGGFDANGAAAVAYKKLWREIEQKLNKNST